VGPSSNRTMRSIAGSSLLTWAVLSLWATSGASAAEPVDVDVVTSLTGGAAFLGQSGQKTLQIAEKTVNDDGGIQGRPLRFVFHDDQTSPQVAVQITGEIVAKGAPVFLGAMLYAQCKAMAPLVQGSGPTMYCLSPAMTAQRGDYVFASFLPTSGIAEAVLRYFHSRGWNRLGMLNSADATGQDAERAFGEALKKPALAAMSVVDREQFNGTDVSVGAQIERLRAANPDALIAYTTGAAMGTVFRGLTQAGFDVPVATSTGNVLYANMNQFASVLPKQLFFAAGAGSASGSGLRLAGGVVAQKRLVDAAFQKTGAKPDFGTEVVWDPAMIAVDALRHVGPAASAAAVQNHILSLTSYQGLSGTYDFSKYPMSGLGAENALVVRWSAAREDFEAVSEPGGEAIPH
jgi:branched-chain amino acid transport system substrate-binding protein